jgi:hypothetical protein
MDNTAVVTHIDADECICGPKRKSPRPDCWATEHDCAKKLNQDIADLQASDAAVRAGRGGAA